MVFTAMPKHCRAECVEWSGEGEQEIFKDNGQDTQHLGSLLWFTRMCCLHNIYTIIVNVL